MSTPVSRPDRRLRVLHVVWRLSPTGGIPVVVRQVVAGLDPARFDVHVATVRPAFEEDDLGALGPHVTVHPLGMEGSLGPARKVDVARRVAALVRALRPDVLHAHSGTGWYALLGRAPARVLEVHDAPGSERHGRVTDWLESRMAGRWGWVALAHSSSVRDEVARATGRPPGEVRLVPLGVDVASFDGDDGGGGAAWRAAHGIGPDERVVLSVGRVVASKNLPLLADVAACVDAVVVHVGGGTPPAELDGRVRFVGPADDLAAAYAACDVFVSTSDYEGFGLAIAEAMAAGRPVVATAVGGVVDLVVDGETGLLAPKGDAAAIAGAVQALLDDPDRRRRMGDAGRARARRRFDVAAMVRGYEALYDELAGRPPVAVQVLKSPDFGAWQRELGPEAGLPYRLDHLAAAGMRPRWSDAVHRPGVRAVSDRLARLGPPSVQTLLALPGIATSPVTLALFESEGNFLAWLRRLGVPPTRRTRLAVVTCWLAELLPTFPSDKRAWYRRTYDRGVDRLYYFSSNQEAVLAEHLGFGPDRLRFVEFGVDDELFRPVDAPDEGYLLAVGRDKGRDWETTFAAARAAGVPLRVLCRPHDIAGLDVPDDVEVLGYVDRRRYRELLAGARGVVVATRVLAYPTGQSVTLEAMAMGKCCIVTDTPAMADYLTPAGHAVTVPPFDAAALADAFRRVAGDESLRAEIGRRAADVVAERFTARRMWATIGADLRRLAAGAP